VFSLFLQLKKKVRGENRGKGGGGGGRIEVKLEHMNRKGRGWSDTLEGKEIVHKSQKKGIQLGTASTRRTVHPNEMRDGTIPPSHTNIHSKTKMCAYRHQKCEKKKANRDEKKEEKAI
jgi:hypothetical protein